MLSLFTSKFGALVDIKRGFKVFFFEIVLPEKGGGSVQLCSNFSVNLIYISGI